MRFHSSMEEGGESVPSSSVEICDRRDTKQVSRSVFTAACWFEVCAAHAKKNGRLHAEKWHDL